MAVGICHYSRKIENYEKMNTLEIISALRQELDLRRISDEPGDSNG